MKERTEKQKIYQVTWRGAMVNIILTLLKFIAAIVGHSAAILSDAVHSMSDLFTDFIVLFMVKIGRKPKDKGHDYGHGKYVTLATAILGIILFVVGIIIFYYAMLDTIKAFQGYVLERPGYIALIAALLSIILKEWAYRFTIRTARETNSTILIANAWHHRSDCYSSIGTSIGIFCAIFLGEKWRVLDPITAIIVSIFILRIAFILIINSIKDLLEASLPDEVEEEIVSIAKSEEGVTDVHHLMTRRIGKNYAIEMHVTMPGDLSVEQAHNHVVNIERMLVEKYGEDTHIGIYIDPIKTSSSEENGSDVED